MARQKGKLSFTNAAEVILCKKKTPMHVRDIVAEGLKRGLIQTSGKTPHLTMSSSLYIENKDRRERGNKTRFKRVGRSTWMLEKLIK